VSCQRQIIQRDGADISRASIVLRYVELDPLGC
jgi:hypothetical protein